MIQLARQRLDRAVLGMLDREAHRLESLRSRPVLARPQLMLDQRAADLGALRDRAARCLDHRVAAAVEELRHTTARLRGLSPAATLERGYAIVQREDGQVVRAAREVAKGDPLRVRLADGELAATVDG